MENKILYKDLTDKIIKCFYAVFVELGGGFLESVYEKSLAIELSEKGLKYEIQKALDVIYKKQLLANLEQI